MVQLLLAATLPQQQSLLAIFAWKGSRCEPQSFFQQAEDALWVWRCSSFSQRLAALYNNGLPTLTNRSQVREALKTGILDCPARKNADGTSLAEQYKHSTCVLTTDGNSRGHHPGLGGSLKGRRVNLAAVAGSADRDARKG